MHRMLSDLIAPHYCYSCGEVGAILCQNCKYDITLEPYDKCLVCLAPTSGATNLCRQCIRPYSKAWCVGEKLGALEKIIDAHKFERAKDAYRSFASLLHESLPVLPADIVIVPVPTVAKHIRQRGYDHTLLLTREIARVRSATPDTPLSRTTTATQRGAGKRERWEQARHAYACRPLDGGTYLLVDDVYTTGATAEYASKALLSAGADEVWLAVIARQPLEK